MTAEKYRVNARLPAEVARKVAYLERRTKMTTTEVLLASIERYYEAMTAGEGTALTALTEAGFIACATGPKDLSVSYKEESTRSLAKKA